MRVTQNLVGNMRGEFFVVNQQVGNKLMFKLEGPQSKSDC